MDLKIKETLRQIGEQAEKILPNNSQETPAEKEAEHSIEATAEREREAAYGEQSVKQAVQAVNDAANISSIKDKQLKSETIIRVEKILEEGLDEDFSKMSADRKSLFKKQGEKTALSIVQLLSSAKNHANKIFDLIVKWLRLIPGINKFFLEQEAKIKADRLIAFSKERQKHN